ncbi:MAG: DoxX family protein [Planctomycetaceae bacterium]|nr:DoxX family protein [Planctomycetaceae bacterium]
MDKSSWKNAIRWVFVGAFLSAGVAHFLVTDVFVSIVPSYLPAQRKLVLISGVFEILGGFGLVIPSLRRWAGFGLIVLLIAVFPANIQMALSPEPFVEKGIPLWALYFRLPMQFVFMLGVWWCSQTERTV